MSKIDIAIRVAENQTMREMGSKISTRMKASVAEAGHVDSLRRAILSHVAGENYERAIEDLTAYVEMKSEYPQFKSRAGRYVGYGVDLINAIKAKRSFPGLEHLSMSKQQELFDRAMEHFEDLKKTLKKIEQVDHEVKIEDVRSTVWVVKAFIYSVFAVLVLAFLLEISKGVLPATMVLVDDASGDLINALFDKLGI